MTKAALGLLVIRVVLDMVLTTTRFPACNDT